jgi:hypothetical protein
VNSTTNSPRARTSYIHSGNQNHSTNCEFNSNLSIRTRPHETRVIIEYFLFHCENASGHLMIDELEQFINHPPILYNFHHHPLRKQDLLLQQLQKMIHSIGYIRPGDCFDQLVSTIDDYYVNVSAVTTANLKAQLMKLFATLNETFWSEEDMQCLCDHFLQNHLQKRTITRHEFLFAFQQLYLSNEIIQDYNHRAKQVNHIKKILETLNLSFRDLWKQMKINEKQQELLLLLQEQEEQQNLNPSSSKEGEKEEEEEEVVESIEIKETIVVDPIHNNNNNNHNNNVEPLEEEYNPLYITVQELQNILRFLFELYFQFQIKKSSLITRSSIITAHDHNNNNNNDCEEEEHNDHDHGDYYYYYHHRIHSPHSRVNTPTKSSSRMKTENKKQHQHHAMILTPLPTISTTDNNHCHSHCLESSHQCNNNNNNDNNNNGFLPSIFAGKLTTPTATSTRHNNNNNNNNNSSLVLHEIQSEPNILIHHSGPQSNNNHNHNRHHHHHNKQSKVVMIDPLFANNNNHHNHSSTHLKQPQLQQHQLQVSSSVFLPAIVTVNH